MNSVSRWLILLVISLTLTLMACTDEVIREVPVEKIVTQEVVREVPVEKIVEVERTVVETVEIEKPVEVIKEVVKEVRVPGETVVVEKEVVRTVEVEVRVPGETVVVEKEVVRTVEVVVTAVPAEGEPGLAKPVAVSNPPGKSKQAAGDVVYATHSVGQFYGGLNSQGPMRIGHEFVCEDLFTPTKIPGEHVGFIAKSWTLDDDLNGATVKIVEGAQFHLGYGELTAQDVAWSYNDANPGTNPESVTDGSGDYKGFLGTEEQEALDKYTVKLNWSAFDPRWNSFFFGEDGLHACIYSEKAFLENGGYDDTSWQFEHQVGTGPFELKEFSRDDRFVFERVEDHWRIIPEIKKLTQFKIPDNAVKLAMLETGQADIAYITAQDLFGAALRGGFASASSGAGGMYAMWFPGNLWEDKHPKTGEPLERNTYVHDIPWVGNPTKPNDPDNPEGMDDMEQARLVREALALAVDRELLLDVILLGNGNVQHSVHYDTRDPLWEKRWEFGYDPAKAEALLDQAGFPKGKDGWRFKMPMYGATVGATADMTDAIAGMYRDIGVEATTHKYQYSVWRPSVVTRSATMPWLDGWSANRPYDEPIGAQCSAVTRGGKSRGAESAECTKAYLSMGAELDKDKRLELARDFATWNRKWVMHFGIASGNAALVVNPTYIKDWEMYVGKRYLVNSWENIKLK